MRNLIFIIFSFLFLFSCSDDKKHDIEVLVKEWNNKEIRFPENSVFTRYVTDTVPYRIPKTDYKVVVFVDSVGCISCKLQLSRWKEFMHEVDSLSDGNVPFVFFFQTKVLAAGYSVYASQQNAEMSDHVLANVEALSDGENDNQGTLYRNPSGTRFCCCPGSTRTCSAAKCANC